ncbi:MAG: class I SAM-dependent methyltransferase [Gaiellaceae bacterium]
MNAAAVQGELWGSRARDWADIQEQGALPLFESVADGMGVGTGTRLLDVACGAGLFCALAADAGAEVAGLDASVGMIEIARERVPEGDFRVGDMEELPFADGAFDLVTGFNAFQFATDAVRAVREAGRAVHGEGRVVVAVWGAQDDCDASAVLAAIRTLLPDALPGGAGPYAFSDEGALVRLVETAGLRAGDVHEVPCPWTYPDLDTAVRGLASAGPAVLAERTVGREAVERAVAEALQPFGDLATGTYRLENVFQYVVARPA